MYLYPFTCLQFVFATVRAVFHHQQCVRMFLSEGDGKRFWSHGRIDDDVCDANWVFRLQLDPYFETKDKLTQVIGLCVAVVQEESISAMLS